MADPILQFKFLASNDINIELRDQKECSGHPYGLEFAGHGQTDNNGHWTIDLGAIACVRPGPGGDYRAAFVATPFVVTPPKGGGAFAPRPSTLEVFFDGTNANHVEVRSYDLSGKPAPDVWFSWIAVIPGTLVKS